MRSSSASRRCSAIRPPARAARACSSAGWNGIWRASAVARPRRRCRRRRPEASSRAGQGESTPMKPTALLLGLGLLLGACAPWAQESDPLFDEDASLEEENAESGRWYGDLQLRYDHLGSLNPLSGTKRMERARGRLRFGYRGTHENLEYAIAMKLARGNHSNKETRSWLDNEKSNAEELDEAMLRWTFEDSTQLLLGKTALPLDLSPMLWDHDLRPAGVSVARSFPVGDLDRFSFTGGYFRPMHLYGDDSNLGAVQLGYHWREGAPLSGAVKLAYLDFGNL